MSSPVAVPRRSHRFALLYAIAWLPYVAVYASVMTFSGEASTIVATVAAVAQALPAALFGLIVLRVCRHVPWDPDRRRHFLLVHLGVGLGYAALASISSGLLFYLLFIVLELGSEMMREAQTSALAIFTWQMFMGSMVYTTITSVTYAFHSIGRLQEARERAAQANALRVEAELQALRAQLNPHFLFNTLHSLISLVRSDPDGAEDAIERFADLMRYASRIQEEKRDLVQFAEEWEFVQNYLALESLRLGDRLIVRADIDPDALDVLVPAFTLQPLVENAIRHAIAPLASGGAVWIRGTFSGDTLEISVRDEGPGTDPAQVWQNGRMGLRLVRDRLDAIFGARAHLHIDTSPTRGFAVKVVLPVTLASPVLGT